MDKLYVMMIIPPNTADVMEKPMKTPPWKINENQAFNSFSVAYLSKHTMFDYDVPTTVIILRLKTEAGLSTT